MPGQRRGDAATLSAAAAAVLRDHSWPGNIRELRNVMERAMIVAEGRPIGPEDLALPGGAKSRVHQPKGEGRRPTLAEHEREYLVQVLEETAWVIAGPKGAAKLLDMPESTLRGRMAALGIKRPGST